MKLSLTSNSLFSVQKFKNRKYCTINKKLYDLLEIKKNFQQKELKTQYHKLCKKHHPDTNNGKSIKFLEINKAYQILSSRLKRNEYDRLDVNLYQQFVENWEKEFDISQEPIKIKIKPETSKKNLVPDFFQLIINKFMGNFLQIKQETNNNNNSSGQVIPSRFSHLYFILDNSSSMHNTNLIDKCLDGIKNFIEELSFDKKILISLHYFSTVQTTDFLQKQIDDAYQHVSNINYVTLAKQAGYTCLYDAIFECINTTQNLGKMDKTTFIVFSDGDDNQSNINLNYLLKFMKQNNKVNIIIVTYDMEATNMKAIVDAAKFGRLLRIGKQYEFKSIGQAFRKTKDLILNVDTINYLIN